MNPDPDLDGSPTRFEIFIAALIFCAIAAAATVAGWIVNIARKENP